MQVPLVLIARSMKLEMNMLVSPMALPHLLCIVQPSSLNWWHGSAPHQTELEWKILHPSEPRYDSSALVWYNQVWIIPGVKLGVWIRIPVNPCTAQVQVLVGYSLLGSWNNVCWCMFCLQLFHRDAWGDSFGILCVTEGHWFEYIFFISQRFFH